LSLLNELRRRNVLRVGAAYIVLAWLVIQVVETVFPAFGFGDAPVRIAVLLSAVGFFPALTFAWVFEITPEGVKKEKDIDRSQSITSKTAKQLDHIILVVLAIALGYFAIDKFVFSQQREASIADVAREEGRSAEVMKRFGPTSIAVLPFTDMSAESDQEYFSDGISEELLNLLAKIPELRVISRTSAFSFKDQKLEIPEIAARLNVEHILEGSVRKAGYRLRITAQLIEASTDSHLWSETYDRDMGNIFAIQDEIALAVVDELKIRLLDAPPKVKETTPEAYSLFLQADHLSEQVTATSLRRARDLYLQGMELDPNYAAAWLGLATAYDRMAALQLMPSNEAMALANEASERAMELAPDSAAVYEMMAWMAMRNGGDLNEVAAYMRRALQLDPRNNAALGNAALLLSSLGREEQAVALSEYQVLNDPANSVAFNNLGMRYRFVGDYAKAGQAFRTALDLNPSSFGTYYELCVTHLLAGNYDEAEESIAREQSEVFKNLGQALVDHAKGRHAQSDAIVEELIGDYGDQLSYYLAQLMAFTGKLDEAFFWLERAKLSGDSEVASGLREPLFTALYDDPRWLLFWRSIDRSPEQMASVEFDIAIPNQ
jgi:adenylate cyclase